MNKYGRDCNREVERDAELVGGDRKVEIKMRKNSRDGDVTELECKIIDNRAGEIVTYDKVR